MADSPKDSDQSMEDILQSIKRIIADEGDAAPAPAAESDVLELTDLLAEDVAVPQVAANEPAPTVAAESVSLDELMAEPPAPTPAPAPMPAAKVEPAPTVIAAPAPEPEKPVMMSQPAAAPRAQEQKPAPVAASVPAHDDDQLMSDSTMAASIAALNALSQASSSTFKTSPSPVLRSGYTVEDLVIEVLRPVVKEWLDANLPALVRQMVEREIRRLTVF